MNVSMCLALMAGGGCHHIDAPGGRLAFLYSS